MSYHQANDNNWSDEYGTATSSTERHVEADGGRAERGPMMSNQERAETKAANQDWHASHRAASDLMFDQMMRAFR